MSPPRTTRALAGALRRQTVQVGASTPAVAGASSRLAVVDTVAADGTVTTTDGIIVRRLRSYANAAPGDVIRLDGATGGSWTTPGRLATTADDPWAAYTMAWTAATTAPVFGNAVRTSRFALHGKTCHVAVRLAFGSSTTYGTGAYGFSVPFPAASNVIDPVGVARLTAGSTYMGQCILPVGSSVMSATFPTTGSPAVGSNLAQGVPVTLANGHILRMFLTYEIA